MVYLLAPHASALQMNTMKFKLDFIGPLFIDTALDKTHYRLKEATALLLDGTYHVNHVKKGSAHTPLGIVDCHTSIHCYHNKTPTVPHTHSLSTEHAH